MDRATLRTLLASNGDLPEVTGVVPMPSSDHDAIQFAVGSLNLVSHNVGNTSAPALRSPPELMKAFLEVLSRTTPEDLVSAFGDQRFFGLAPFFETQSLLLWRTSRFVSPTFLHHSFLQTLSACVAMATNDPGVDNATIAKRVTATLTLGTWSEHHTDVPNPRTPHQMETNVMAILYVYLETRKSCPGLFDTELAKAMEHEGSFSTDKKIRDAKHLPLDAIICLQECTLDLVSLYQSWGFDVIHNGATCKPFAAICVPTGHIPEYQIYAVEPRVVTIGIGNTMICNIHAPYSGTPTLDDATTAMLRTFAVPNKDDDAILVGDFNYGKVPSCIPGPVFSHWVDTTLALERPLQWSDPVASKTPPAESIFCCQGKAWKTAAKDFIE